MATFPTWILKKNNSNTSTSNGTGSLSPRQIANKAYTLSSKKLGRDERQSKTEYGIREKLLISQTMIKAEALLNKRTARYNRRVMAFETDEDDDILIKKERITTPPPLPLLSAVPLTQKCDNVINLESLLYKLPTTTLLDENKQHLTSATTTCCDSTLQLSMHQQKEALSSSSSSSSSCCSQYNAPLAIAAESLMTVLQESNLMLSINAVITVAAAAVAAEVPTTSINECEHPLLSTTENSSSTFPFHHCLAVATTEPFVCSLSPEPQLLYPPPRVFS